MIPQRGSYQGQSHLLFSDYNDVHLFVEDKGFENLYEEILRRLGLSVAKVFSLNGKIEVLDRAAACTDSKCLYLVDRDWDDFHGRIVTRQNVLTLAKYSVENYLLHYSGFRSIVIAANPRKKVDTILSKSEFNHIATQVAAALKPLFQCFLAMEKTGDGRKTCSLRPGKFQKKNKSCAPDENVIRSHISDMDVEIPQDVVKYFSESKLLSRGVGKYLLHFIWNEICQKSPSKSVSKDSLLIRLAQTIDINQFKLLEREIRKIAQGSRSQR